MFSFTFKKSVVLLSIVTRKKPQKQGHSGPCENLGFSRWADNDTNGKIQT